MFVPRKQQSHRNIRHGQFIRTKVSLLAQQQNRKPFRSEEPCIIDNTEPEQQCDHPTKFYGKSAKPSQFECVKKSSSNYRQYQGIVWMFTVVSFGSIRKLF